MSETLEIEMDCGVCGRYSTAPICPACARAQSQLEAAIDAKPGALAGRASEAAAVRTAQVATERSPTETARIDDVGSRLRAQHAREQAALANIAAESRANAAVQGIGSMSGGQLAGVGFNTREGYITAIRHGVPLATREEYLATLRTRFGMTSADLAALALPGPMTVTELPVGEGIKHVPSGPSIFDRPAAERGFKVGDAPAEPTVLKPADLKTGQLVAVAHAHGHGCVIAWHGRHPIARGELRRALESLAESALLPRPNSPRAQAGRALTALNHHGLVVRAEPKPIGALYTARWTVGRVNHGGGDGDSLGRVVATATLVDDTLTVSGSENLAVDIQASYRNLLDEQIYASADVTGWLGGILRKRCDAVEFGALGWYVPPKHTAWANALCAAVKSAGFGVGWVVPGLPVTDGDRLRDGILGGLTEEVDRLMARLYTERTAAREARENGSIGPKRAATFLTDLRKIGERVAAYAVVLGDERVASAKAAIRAGIVELEGILGADYAGISARFAGVWDEIERDRRAEGGVL